jgi:hypothetical protein
MGEVIQFPIRASKAVELVYIKEFGYLVCPHKIYLPTQHCSSCAEKEREALLRYLTTNV